ncbi:hypothetical protein GCM10009837_52510 [Streptomyces durmitorensis]
MTPPSPTWCHLAPSGTTPRTKRRANTHGTTPPQTNFLTFPQVRAVNPKPDPQSAPFRLADGTTLVP